MEIYTRSSWRGKSIVLKGDDELSRSIAAVTSSIVDMCRGTEVICIPHSNMPNLSNKELIDWLPIIHNREILVDDIFQYISTHGVHEAMLYPFYESGPLPSLEIWEKDHKWMVAHGRRRQYDPPNGINRVKIDRHFKFARHPRSDGISDLDFDRKIVTRLNIQPIVGNMRAHEDFEKITGKGLFNRPGPRKYTVLITGYGYGDGVDFFEVKGAFGPLWADEGYTLIAKDLIYEIYFCLTPSVTNHLEEPDVMDMDTA